MNIQPTSFRVVLRIAWMELLSSVRDRMTVLYAIVLPLVLYPVLLFVAVQVYLLVRGREQHTEVRLGVMAPSDQVQQVGTRGSPTEGILQAVCMRAPDEWMPDSNTTTGTATNVEAVRIVEVRSGEREEALAWLSQADAPDAVLLVGTAPGAQTELVYDSTTERGDLAARRIQPRLATQAENLRLVTAQRNNVPPARMDAVADGGRRDLSPNESKAAFLMSFLLPMLLVFMTLSGAFYPAIDVTAGERERGTHDTTLLLPVDRATVLQGKILAVAALAMTATLLNVLALGLSVGHLLTMLKGGGASLDFDVPWTAFAAITPLALLFAFFVAASLMVFASRAKTFKEGQAALGPLQMLFYLPAMAGAMPGLVLTKTLACVPVLNVVLAFRDLLKGRWAPVEYSLVAISLLVFALLAVRGATWFLQREQEGRPLFTFASFGRKSA